MWAPGEGVSTGEEGAGTPPRLCPLWDGLLSSLSGA